MSQRMSVSVVVVSRGRPEALARCLTGLTQLYYPNFEIIVVADGPGLNRLDMIPALFGRIKRFRFDDANISHARNLGIARAAGEIVAFIDDDAVPEPTWLDHLIPPFSDDRVMSAGGSVLGRNGFSLQWRPRCVHANGQTDEIALTSDSASLFNGRPGLGIKTEGTNMAIRRSILCDMGGFDPAFRFYLDETDLNLRLATEHRAAAVVPMAIVHHGFEESERRRRDRVPLTLYDVGASLAVFLRKHADVTDHADALRRERKERRGGVLGHLVAGRIEPRDVGRILATFEEGVEAGQFRALKSLTPLPDAIEPYKRFPTRDAMRGQHRLIAGRPWARRRLIAEAKSHVEAGYVTTVLLLSPNARPHVQRYHAGGFWLQTGGTLGRADRSRPLKIRGFSSRIAVEATRIEAVRSHGNRLSSQE